IPQVADQMIKLQHLLQLHDCDVRLRFYTASQLQLCFSRLFPTLSVLPFGSSVTGFGLLKCDLDLVSKQNLMYYYKQYSYTERGEQQQFLKLLAYIASKFIPGISNTQCILEARVPIIKFHNRLTHLYCDLSSTHLTAFHMSEILFTYGQFDPRVKPLVYTIRTWAKSQKLTNDSPGRWISNFSLTLMIIFYLQSKKILPPMKKLFSQKGEPDFFNLSAKCSFFLTVNGTLKQITTSKIDLSTKSYTLYELLCDFFEYYIIFDFKIYGLCILDGVMKRKLDASPVYIFNPLEPMLNVSKNITTTELFNIKTQMQEAILAMKKDKLFNILYLLNMSPNDEGRDQKNVTSSNVATTSITSYKSVSTNRECDERENSINNVAPGEQSKSAAEEFLIETGIVDDTNKLDEIIK
ncbi:Poly(A) RNA polymerase, mitochondrial, partial [Dufourea novaeangliae]